MSTIKNYYQLKATIEPKIIGKSELPLTVEIKDKTFESQSREYMLNIDKYFEDKDGILKHFPQNLVGKMYQKKKDPIDIMLSMPMYMSIDFIVSKRVKNILDELNINPTEYQTVEFSIEGQIESYYFLFIPMLRNKDYVDYRKSVFHSSRLDNTTIFGTYEEYLLARNNGYRVKTLYVSDELSDRDIISLQAAGPFFSERIVEAFNENMIVGYDIIKGGDFKVDLKFS
ncbi:hypothetical protein BBI01_06775 [Chryseobacterium artocarpi]|uniref:Immunity MXAN-0049 protein domain-containing protein n=1 Tax=Chryseobacterium artocarpi TaxID=1414727 RepID=A0A1B8ZXS4_9FLAO|nr:DUF1629 domain-containing protein [Chryseobacterium artocarpi]OCA76389.1 hypothetical protein BBI01_06775 [Chryseobacterium artocarpi]